MSQVARPETRLALSAQAYGDEHAVALRIAQAVELPRVESAVAGLGICVLTTNMEGSIDEAFRRRMRFRIEFPKPSIAEQAELWRNMITPQAKVAPDVPWLAIAEQFPEMTGGHIRSAVLRAAFLAVAEGGIINVDRIRRAAYAEYEELGHIAHSGASSAKRSRL